MRSGSFNRSPLRLLLRWIWIVSSRPSSVRWTGVLGFQHAMILLKDQSADKLKVAASRGHDHATVGAEVALGQVLLVWSPSVKK